MQRAVQLRGLRLRKVQRDRRVRLLQVPAAGERGELHAVCLRPPGRTDPEAGRLHGVAQGGHPVGQRRSGTRGHCGADHQRNGGRDQRERLQQQDTVLDQEPEEGHGKLGRGKRVHLPGLYLQPRCERQCHGDPFARNRGRGREHAGAPGGRRGGVRGRHPLHQRRSNGRKGVQARTGQGNGPSAKEAGTRTT